MISEQIQPLITCKILLTSPSVRTNAELLADQKAAAVAEIDNSKNILEKGQEKSKTGKFYDFNIYSKLLTFS